MVLHSVETILLVACGVPAGYLALLSFLALFKRRRYIAEQRCFRRFAVVIPAHNEEQTIGKTLCSAFAIDYPRRYFDVVVIADNCTDQTASVARSFGARVLERSSDNKRGKGYALRWCFDTLLNENPSFDSVCVVDADSTISPNFLTVMNHYLEAGSRVIQARDLVEPRHKFWTVEIIRLGFALYNYARPLGRSILGCSMGLRGNGMCFHVDVLRKYPWEAMSLTEDLEYGLNLLLHGERVDLAQEAQVLATMPENPRNAESQRARWESGRFPIVRMFTFPLLKRVVTRFSFVSLDALIDLVTPPFVNLFFSIIAFGAATGLLVLLRMKDLLPFLYLWGIVSALALVHVFAGLIAVRAKSSLYKALLYVPRYAMWKIALYAKIFRRGRGDQWVRTTRESHDIAKP